MRLRPLGAVVGVDVGILGELGEFLGLLATAGVSAVPQRRRARAHRTTRAVSDGERDAFLVAMFNEHGVGLVRMARLFVDDRNAAEDLVQEAFIRLARSMHRISDDRKAAAYLRSIVLNLVRDHNRRGLLSLRHQLPSDENEASIEDVVVLHERQQQVIEAVGSLPRRQRDCLILRYYDELGVDEIAETLGISRNSVKTHLTRGLRGLSAQLADPPTADSAEIDAELVP